MRENMPGPRVERSGNGALYEQETPSWPAAEGAQGTLGSPDEKALLAASRMGALLKEAQRASDFTLGTVGRLAGTETPYVSKAFDLEAPHRVLRMFAAILYLDISGVFLRGVAQMTGRDVVERPRLTPEQKLARIEEALRRHGKAGEALLAEAYGEDAP
jgi:hypothetical protein